MKGMWAALILAATAQVGAQEVGTNVNVQGNGPTSRVDAQAYNNTPNGYANARSRTNGRTAFGQAEALGWDQNGAYYSTSYGVRGPGGNTIGGTFSMGIGTDGQATVNGGSAVARGPFQQSVQVGSGVQRTGPVLGGRTDVRANTDPFGSARVNAYGRHYGPMMRPHPGYAPRPY